MWKIRCHCVWDGCPSPPLAVGARRILYMTESPETWDGREFGVLHDRVAQPHTLVLNGKGADGTGTG